MEQRFTPHTSNYKILHFCGHFGDPRTQQHLGMWSLSSPWGGFFHHDSSSTSRVWRSNRRSCRCFGSWYLLVAIIVLLLSLPSRAVAQGEYQYTPEHAHALVQPRRLWHFGPMERICIHERTRRPTATTAVTTTTKTSLHRANPSLSGKQIQLVKNRKTRRRVDGDSVNDNHNDGDSDSHVPANHNHNHNNRMLWPPWPFNLIGRKSKSATSSDAIDNDDTYPSTGSLFWAYLRQRSRVGIRQIQQRTYVVVVGCCRSWFWLCVVANQSSRLFVRVTCHNSCHSIFSLTNPIMVYSSNFDIHIRPRTQLGVNYGFICLPHRLHLYYSLPFLSRRHENPNDGFLHYSPIHLFEI